MLLKFVSPPNGNSEFVIADLIRNPRHAWRSRKAWIPDRVRDDDSGFVIADLIRNPRPAWHDLWKAH